MAIPKVHLRRIKRKISSRFGAAAMGIERLTYGPTPTHTRSVETTAKHFREVKPSLEAIADERLPAFEKRVRQAGAPWIDGQPIPDPKWPAFISSVHDRGDDAGRS